MSEEVLKISEHTTVENVPIKPAASVNRNLSPNPDSSVVSASELPDIVPTPVPVIEAKTSIELNDHVNEGSKDIREPSEDAQSKNEGSKDISEPSEDATPANDWVDILGNQQLMKKVIRAGRGISTRPTPQSRVKVGIKGHLESGEEVEKLKQIVFTVGDGDVIQALDLCLTLMETGELCELKTSSRFAYGNLGKPPEIPPNADLVYEVELLEVLEPLNYQSISQVDLLAAVDKKRVRGNELFKRQEFDKAINSYQKGLQMLKVYSEEHKVEDSDSELQEMEIRCWNNVAAAQLKVEHYKEVLESCSHVLNKDPDNVKALFRSGKVLSLRGEMDMAVKRLQKAANLSPDEKAIQQELQRAMSKRNHMKEKEKAMYKRMVEGAPPAKTVKTKPSTERQSWGPLPYLTAALVVATIGIGLAYFITQRH